MRRRYKPRRKKPRYITNEHIRGETLRVIDETGKQIGLLTRDQAFKFAQEKEVDLVLIAPGVTPPVVKAIDVKKHAYNEEKKKKEGKRGVKKSQTKDIKFSLFISDNDKERLRKKSEDFLVEGHQVRLRIPLRGREMAKKPMAFEAMKKFIDSIEQARPASEPRFQGRVLTAIISRKKS